MRQTEDKQKIACSYSFSTSARANFQEVFSEKKLPWVFWILVCFLAHFDQHIKNIPRCVLFMTQMFLNHDSPVYHAEFLLDYPFIKPFVSVIFLALKSWVGVHPFSNPCYVLLFVIHQMKALAGGRGNDGASIFRRGQTVFINTGSDRSQ